MSCINKHVLSCLEYWDPTCQQCVIHHHLKDREIMTACWTGISTQTSDLKVPSVSMFLFMGGHRTSSVLPPCDYWGFTSTYIPEHRKDSNHMCFVTEILKFDHTTMLNILLDYILCFGCSSTMLCVVVGGNVVPLFVIMYGYC